MWWEKIALSTLENKKGCLFLVALFLFPHFALSKQHALGFQIGQAWHGGFIGKGVSATTVPSLFYEWSVNDTFSFQQIFNYTSQGRDFALKSLTINIKSNLFYIEQLVPYVSGGFSFYNVSKDSFNNNKGNIKSTNLGFNINTGADLNLNNSLIFGFGLSFYQLFDKKANQGDKEVEVSGRSFAFFTKMGFLF